MAQPIRFAATVEAVQHHSAEVCSYSLRAQRRLPRFRPGQFIHLALDELEGSGFWPESRVFSVANAVTDRQTINLTVSRQGAYTNRILDTLGVGDQILVKGPYGDFVVGAQQQQRAVLVAGGTGITPFCSYMDAALSAGDAGVEQVHLYYGAQTEDLLIYRELAERCADKLSGFQLVCYVEEGLAESSANLRAGRIDLADIANDLQDFADTAVYLSGPRAMITAFQDQLLDGYHLDPACVRIDAWD